MRGCPAPPSTYQRTDRLGVPVKSGVRRWRHVLRLHLKVSVSSGGVGCGHGGHELRWMPEEFLYLMERGLLPAMRCEPDPLRGPPF